MNRYHLTAIAALTLPLSATVVADPIPDPPGPIQEGKYRTDWGEATFRLLRPKSGESRLAMKMDFTNGTSFSGFIEPESREWYGIWVGTSDMAPRGAHACSQRALTALGERGWTIPGYQGSDWWGYFAGNIGSSGKTLNFRWSSCDEYRARSRRLVEESTLPLVAGHFIPPPVSNGFVDGTANSHVGPCLARMVNPVISVSPCIVPRWGRITLTFRENLGARIERVVFQPIASDPILLRTALAGGRFARHGTLRDIVQPISDPVAGQPGRPVSIAVPGSACYNDLWSIRIQVANQRVYNDIGVIKMQCGPGQVRDYPVPTS